MTATWKGELLERRETISAIRGTAKDDDGGGWPFHEMPCFEKLEEGMKWAEGTKAKGYPYVELCVTFDVVEIYAGSTCHTMRWERPYLYNANIALDAAYYEKLKGYGLLGDGEWVVIRNGELLCSSWEEGEVLRIADQQDGRCLVRKAWHETDHDDLSEVEVMKRANPK